MNKNFIHQSAQSFAGFLILCFENGCAIIGITNNKVKKGVLYVNNK